MTGVILSNKEVNNILNEQNKEIKLLKKENEQLKKENQELRRYLSWQDMELEEMEDLND